MKKRSTVCILFRGFSGRTNILKFTIPVLIVITLLSGCAKVKFYSDPDLTKETGLRFYSAKPYLLVARTGAKDKPVEVSIVYVPDRENPQYAYYRAGMGTNRIDMALLNSILTTYGNQTDSKIPETLSALASLTTATGGAAKAFAEAQKLRAEAAELQASPEEIRQAAKIIKQVARDLREAIQSMGARLDTTAKNEALAIATELDGIVAALEAPTATAQLSTIVQRLKTALAENRWGKLKHTGTPSDPFDFNARIEKDRKQLQDALNLLEPPAPQLPVSSFELYEIRQEKGSTTLIQVLPK